MNSITVGMLRDYDSQQKAKRAFKRFRSNNEKGVTVAVRGSQADGFKSKVGIGNETPKPSAKSDALTKEVSDEISRSLKGKKNDEVVSMTKNFQSATTPLKIKGLDEAFLVEEGETLIARKGKRLISISVKLDGKDKNERTRALSTLARAWLK